MRAAWLVGKSEESSELIASQPGGECMQVYMEFSHCGQKFGKVLRRNRSGHGDVCGLHLRTCVSNNRNKIKGVFVTLILLGRIKV